MNRPTMRFPSPFNFPGGVRPEDYERGSGMKDYVQTGGAQTGEVPIDAYRHDVSVARWRELMALRAEGLDYPDDAVEVVTAADVEPGDVIRLDNAPRWLLVAETERDLSVEPDGAVLTVTLTLRLLRTDDTPATSATGLSFSTGLRSDAPVERLAVGW